jgi:hypothetical protein
MSKILQLKATDGSDLLVEVSDTFSKESFRGTQSENRGIIEDTKESFDKALIPLKEISNSIIKCIKDISNSPKEVQVELGVKFTAKAGIILTSLDSEAHFRVTLKWEKEKVDSKNPSS